MIPAWLQALSRLTPVLILVAIGLVIFGIYRLFDYIAMENQEREEEERQRQKLLAQLKPKIDKVTSKESQD